MFPEEKSIQAVIEGCAKRGVQVSEELASVFYKSCAINPNPHENTRGRKKKSDDPVAKIVNQCINSLSVRGDNPVVECVKMQLLVERDYKNREHVVNKVNEDNEKNIEPILNEILDNGDKITDETSIYHQKMLQYIIVTNYAGDPTSPTIIQETYNALREIINRRSGPLSDSENQSPSTKKKQLKETADLVCGITLSSSRANRRDCKEEILHMVDSLPDAVELLLQKIDRELDSGSKRITKLTSWILQYYRVDKDLLAPLFVMRTRMAVIGNDQLDAYKSVLAFYHQYEKNLKTMRKDLSESKSEIPALLDKYNAKLREIRHGLKNTNGYDETIYPQLFDLSTVWREMMETLNYLSITANLLLTMMQMTNEAMNVGETIKKTSASKITLIQNIEEKEEREIIETHPLHPMCQWYPASSEDPANEKNLFADGYCVVMIVETNGTLIRHDKNLGLIQYCDEWFSFSCIQAALHFGTKPSYYLNGFFNLLRSQTHLLFFFHLYERTVEKQYVPNKIMRIKHTKIKYGDAQVQTEVINPSYDEEIITKKENIRNTNGIKPFASRQDDTQKKVPRSAQTVDVYKSVQVQTASCDVGCNTTREKGTNTNQSVSYLSIRSKHEPYEEIKYGDTKSLIFDASNIVHTNKAQQTNKLKK